MPKAKLCSPPGTKAAGGKVRVLQHPEHGEVCSPSERSCGTKARCPGSTHPVTVIKALAEQGNTKRRMRGCLRQGKNQLNFQLLIQHPEIPGLLAASFFSGTKEAERESCVLCLPPGSLPGPTGTHSSLTAQGRGRFQQQVLDAPLLGRPAELTTQKAKRRTEDLLIYPDSS